MSDPKPVSITLSHDEAIVLHEWLARVIDDENAAGIAGTTDHDAEIWALHAVFVLLEKALPEPFEPGFEKTLRAARKRILDGSGPWPHDAADAD